MCDAVALSCRRSPSRLPDKGQKKAASGAQPDCLQALMVKDSLQEKERSPMCWWPTSDPKLDRGPLQAYPGVAGLAQRVVQQAASARQMQQLLRPSLQALLPQELPGPVHARAGVLHGLW